LRDEKLPDDVDGIVVGGGFPETYADELSANASMRTSVADAVRSGVPVAAECGGLLYLGARLDGRPMCGVLDVEAEMSDRLTLGYREAVAAADSTLFPAGCRVRGHEFHRTVVAPPGGPVPAWNWRGPAGAVTEGFVSSSVHASYLHLHWAGVPGIADRFVAACVAARAAR
jgi:cobyrinic acid a,c-diamide synthase